MVVFLIIAGVIVSVAIVLILLLLYSLRKIEFFDDFEVGKEI